MTDRRGGVESSAPLQFDAVTEQPGEPSPGKVVQRGVWRMSMDVISAMFGTRLRRTVPLKDKEQSHETL